MVDTLNKKIIDPKTGQVSYASGSTIPVDTLNTKNELIQLPNEVKGTSYTIPPMTTFPTGVNTSGQNLTEGQIKEQTSTPTYDELFKQYMTGTTENQLPKMPVVSEEYAKAQQATDITAKQNQVNLYTNQLNQINAEAQQAQRILEQQAGGKDVTTAFLGRQQQEISRQATIKALPISAQLSASQGDLQTAQSNLETMFKLKMEDATNKYNYLKDQRTAVMNYLTEKEKRQVETQQKKDDREFEMDKYNMTQKSSLAKTVMEGGEAQLAGRINALDVKSPTFNQEMSELQAKVKSPIAKLDIAIKQAQLNKLQRETTQVREMSVKEQQAMTNAMKEAKASIPIMKNKINDANDIISSSGFSSRVGSNFLTRLPKGEGLGGISAFALQVIKVPLTLGVGTYKDIVETGGGAGQNFSASVHKLVGGMTLQSLIDAKARGATFGALSEGELSLLASSATKINDWEIKNSKGVGVGVWDIDEASFKKEIEFIKNETARALNLSGETVINDDENAMLEDVFKTSLPEYNYYK